MFDFVEEGLSSANGAIGAPFSGAFDATHFGRSRDGRLAAYASECDRSRGLLRKLWKSLKYLQLLRRRRSMATSTPGIIATSSPNSGGGRHATPEKCTAI